MKKLTGICLVFLIISSWLFSSNFDKQILDNHLKNQKKIIKEKAQKSAEWEKYFDQDSKNMDNYDAIYYKIALDVDFENEMIYGDNIVKIKVLENEVSEIELNFTNNLTIDNITNTEENLEYSHNNHVINIDLGQNYNQNDVIDLNIEYHGHPVEPGRYGWGFVFDQHAGEDIAFTMVEPYASRDWWPCKDLPSDKADSVDLHITVPAEYVCASNGLLTDIVDNDETKTYKWHEAYPISTYLVSIAVTNYEIYSQTYEYETEQMNIDNYLFPESYEQGEALFSQTAEMIDFLTGVYSTYPFLNEKYGHAVYPGNGAMEHQTCTSFGSAIVNPNGSYVVLHELAHQWVGDLITCQNWSHIWLNEGFATYSEVLWTENLGGTPNYHYHMNQIDLGNSLDGSLYREDNGDGAYILDVIVYYKGAWVLHMLRGIVGQETMQQILQTYIQTPELQYETAVTEDFKNISEDVSGMELDWFFDEWFYNNGRPDFMYSTYTKETSDSVKITLYSEGSHGDSFNMYIPLKLNSSEYQLWSEDGFNYYSFDIGDELTTIDFDNDNWVLDYGYEEQIPELDEVRQTRDSFVILNWQEFFDPNISGYNIYRSEESSDFIKINDTPVSGLTFTDEGLETNVEYTYKITTVYDGDYESKFSNEVTFVPVDFTFDEGILVIDNTFDYPETSPFPGDEAVDTFYDNIINAEVTNWDVNSQGAPDLTEMAKYSSIILHNDDIISELLPGEIYNFKSYLNAGGNLFISGWKNLGNEEPDFLNNYLKMENCVINNEADFSGAFGQNSYTDINIDSEKVPMEIWNNNLAYINKFDVAENAEIIYEFNSSSDNQDWENKACGLTYQEEYNLFVIGFPLYYTDLQAAHNLMNDVLTTFDENLNAENETVADAELKSYNYPNPFNPETTIYFEPRNFDNTVISIYNLKGQKVKELKCKIDPHKTMQSVVWDGSDENNQKVSSGIYFYKVSSTEDSVWGKMILIK